MTRPGSCKVQTLLDVLMGSLTFLTDVNVPDSVGTYLKFREHDVVRVRDIMAIGTKDPIIAEAAMQDDRILVSWDKDFNHQRFLKERYRDLNRIGFSCPEPDGSTRLAELIDLVEFAFERACGIPTAIKIGSDKVLIRDKVRY